MVVVMLVVYIFIEQQLLLEDLKRKHIDQQFNPTLSSPRGHKINKTDFLSFLAEFQNTNTKLANFSKGENSHQTLKIC